jgi:hypothetical protein
LKAVKKIAFLLIKLVLDTNASRKSALYTVSRLQDAKSMNLGAIPSGDKKL